MKRPDGYSILMGIFRYSSQRSIPADSRAIHSSLFRFSRLFPELLQGTLFDHHGFNIQLDEHLDNLMINNMLGFFGKKLEMFNIEDKLIKHFDEVSIYKFSEEQIEILKKMGKKLPKMLNKNESNRYKRLVSTDTF
jgi:hypothetical protein